MKTKNNREIETIKTDELSGVKGGESPPVTDRPLLTGDRPTNVPRFG